MNEGHFVQSDNDGEMLVHTVEHYFDMKMDKAEILMTLNCVKVVCDKR